MLHITVKWMNDWSVTAKLQPHIHRSTRRANRARQRIQSHSASNVPTIANCTDRIDRPNKTLSYEFNRLITPIQLHRRRLNLDAAVIIAFSYIWLPLPNPGRLGAPPCPVCGYNEITTTSAHGMHGAVQLSRGCHLTPFVLPCTRLSWSVASRRVLLVSR